jgi:hypothetical protein
VYRGSARARSGTEARGYRGEKILDVIIDFAAPEEEHTQEGDEADEDRASIMYGHSIILAGQR